MDQKSKELYRKRVCENVLRNRKRRKEILLLEFGGHCQICGYSENIEAFEFHHINPDEKERSISSMLGHCSLKRIREEAKKCVLLCSNCHRAVHAGKATIEHLTKPTIYVPSETDSLNLLLSDDVKYRRNVGTRTLQICPVCRKEFRPAREQKYCSVACAHQPTTRLHIDARDLAYWVAHYPTTTVASHFGVSSNTIIKRCKKLGISRDSFWCKQRKTSSNIVSLTEFLQLKMQVDEMSRILEKLKLQINDQ